MTYGITLIPTGGTFKEYMKGRRHEYEMELKRAQLRKERGTAISFKRSV